MTKMRIAAAYAIVTVLRRNHFPPGCQPFNYGETATELAHFIVSDSCPARSLSDAALIAAHAHTRRLYLVQRGNRDKRY